MFKTGKKKQGATRNAHRTTPSAVSRLSGLQSWLLVILGMAIGLFIAFMLYLWKPWQPVQRQAAATTVQPSEQPKDAANGPRFDFYRLLPSQKIVPEQTPPAGSTTPAPASTAPTPPKPDIPVKPKAADTAKPKPEAHKPDSGKTKATTTEPAKDSKEKDAKAKDDGQKYALQAGSFKSQAEADRRRAKILMLGMSAHVQEVKVKEGQMWYRVIVGPVKGKSGAEQAQSSLRGGGIDSLMVKQAESGAK